MTQQEIDRAKEEGRELGRLLAQVESLNKRTTRMEQGVIALAAGAVVQVLKSLGIT